MLSGGRPHLTVGAATPARQGRRRPAGTAEPPRVPLGRSSRSRPRASLPASSGPPTRARRCRAPPPLCASRWGGGSQSGGAAVCPLGGWSRWVRTSDRRQRESGGACSRDANARGPVEPGWSDDDAVDFASSVCCENGLKGEGVRVEVRPREPVDDGARLRGRDAARRFLVRAALPCPARPLGIIRAPRHGTLPRRCEAPRREVLAPATIHGASSRGAPEWVAASAPAPTHGLHAVVAVLTARSGVAQGSSAARGARVRAARSAAAAAGGFERARRRAPMAAFEAAQTGASERPTGAVRASGDVRRPWSYVLHPPPPPHALMTTVQPAGT